MDASEPPQKHQTGGGTLVADWEENILSGLGSLATFGNITGQVSLNSDYTGMTILFLHSKRYSHNSSKEKLISGSDQYVCDSSC